MNKFTHISRNVEAGRKTARVLIAAAAVCAALVSGARAGEVPQAHVKYADLNVGSAAGAAVLYQRIKSAAAQVCGVDGERDLGRRVQAKACETRAIAEAVAAVDAPALTGLYKTHQVGGNTLLASAR
jgi:UrcA family protein